MKEDEQNCPAREPVRSHAWLDHTDITLRPDEVIIMDGQMRVKLTRDEVESLLAGMNVARASQARRREIQSGQTQDAAGKAPAPAPEKTHPESASASEQPQTQGGADRPPRNKQ
jgi:hypothetical protein